MSLNTLLMLKQMCMIWHDLTHVTVLFLHPLGTSENYSFLMFSGSGKRDQWHEMGSHILQW